MKNFYLLIASLLFLAHVRANNYYVNDNSTTGDVYTSAIGNDANAGTAASPYATLAFAYTKALLAGDNIYIDAGTYATLTITIGRAINIYGPNMSISPVTGTRGSEAILNFTADGAAAKDHIIISAATGVVQIKGLRFEDNLTYVSASLLRRVIAITGARNHVIQNNIFYRAAGTSTGSDPEAIGTTIGSAISIDNNLFTGAGSVTSRATWNYGVYIMGGTGAISITNNRFNNIRTQVGIDFNNAVVITGNDFQLGTSSGTGITLAGALVAGTYNFSGNNFSGTLGTYINFSNVSAGYVMDLSTGGSYNGTLFSALSLANHFAFEGKIIHGNTSGKNGLVRVKAGHVYVISGKVVQQSINLASSGDIVNIANATYKESLTINKPLTLLGQSQASTIIMPGTSNPNCSGAGGVSLCAGSSNVILVQSANVTIQDLTVNGDNNSLSGGYTIGGANVDARNGIITDHRLATVYNNLNVNHVTVKNIYLRGIFASTGGSFTFDNNTVSNVQADPLSIAIADSLGAGTCSNNTISTAKDAIASMFSKGSIYSNNAITGCSNGIHTDYNSLAGDIIRSNTITNSTAGGYGIYVLSPFVPPIIDSNTVTNVEVGLGNFAQSAAVIPVFGNNTINGQNKANSIGIYQSTNKAGIGNSNVSGIYQNNFILNNTKGLFLESQLGLSNDVSATDNSITANTSGVALGTGVAGEGTFISNFNCNYWGYVLLSDVATAVGADENYSPFLNNGTDNTPLITGFQPVPGACTISDTVDHFRTAASGNWNNVAAWESSPDNSTWHPATLIPDSGASNLTIRNGNEITLSGNVSINQATINAGGSLIVNSNDTLSVTDGVGADLTVDGSLTINTNGEMILRSTGTGTASVGTSTGTITGEVSVERYISARKAWRFLSVPTNTIQNIKQAWQEGANGTNSNPVGGYGIQITSNRPTWAADGFDLYSSGGPSMKKYIPASNTWEGISNTNSATIKATDGLMTFIRGDRTANAFNSIPTATVLRTKGSLYMGDIAPITVEPAKFAAIGNPYPSALDMRLITKTGLKNFFYLWDPQLGGNSGLGAYQTFAFNGSDYVVTPGMGSYGAAGSVSNFIESGQAFFVEATDPGGSISFKENAKANDNHLVSRILVPGGPQLRTSLYGINANNSTYMIDGVMNNFDDSYSNSADAMDAKKITNTGENLSIKTANALFTVERRHTISAQDTIFLNLANTKVQAYRFEFNAEDLDQLTLVGFVEDNYLHTSTVLNLNGNTVVNFNIVNIPASYAPDRFRIVFRQLPTLPVTFTSIKAYRENSIVNIEWKVENEINIRQYETEKSYNGTQFTTLSTTAARNISGSANYLATDAQPAEGYNYYRVKSIGIDGKTGYTTVVKLFIGKEKQDIFIYPNPVIDGKINIRFSNMPAGDYAAKLLNDVGQEVFTRVMQHSNGSGIELLTFNKKMPRGIYQLEITKPDGNKVTMNVIY